MQTQVEIAKLKPEMSFVGYLLVRSCDKRQGKTGREYLDINLIDRTGEINSKHWNPEQLTFEIKPGEAVWIAGLVETFNGRYQLRINQIRPAREGDVDLALLVPSAPEKPEVMRAEIDRTIASFQSEELRLLVTEMLNLAGDELNWYPAAMRMHHAERSGLLHHTTTMLKIAGQLLEVYPFLNGDLLRAGVIVHDLAKIPELKSDKFGSVSDYSRDGLLVGHLVRGVSMLDEAARNTEVGGEILALLEHMIISHHGIPDYGSPRYPSFPEAEALHWIDTLDAHMNEMQGIMERVPEGAFSERIPYLDDRRIYHPYYTDDAQ